MWIETGFIITWLDDLWSFYWVGFENNTRKNEVKVKFKIFKLKIKIMIHKYENDIKDIRTSPNNITKITQLQLDNTELKRVN